MKKSARKKISAYKIKQNIGLVKLAIRKHKKTLQKKFPNIISISDAVHDLNHHQSHVVAIYISDNNSTGLPEKLHVITPGGKIKEIPTEIVSGIGNGKLFLNQLDGILNSGSMGSLCCMVQMPDKKTRGIITAGHVYTKGYSNLANGWLNEGLKVISDKNTGIGNWSFLMINTLQDLAVIKLDDLSDDPALIKFSSKGFYKVGDKDIKKEKVKLVSRIGGTREGYILDYNCAWPVPYYNGTQLKNNIILVGSTNDRNTSGTLSGRGDSGGCVYHTASGKLVGLILGGDEKFTWVLPIVDTLEYWEFTLL